MHKAALRLGIVISLLLSKASFGAMAQEVTIPGYNPTPVTTSPAPSQLPVVEKPIPVPATEAELNKLFESIDLSGWSAMSSYLWTCTRNSFSVPTYDAKNSIQAAYSKLKKDKKILTLKKASEITNQIGRPVTHQIAGLVGQFCRIVISTIPEPLDCLLTVRQARYLSTLTPLVAANNGKSEFLPKDVFKAIHDLLEAQCNKKLIP